MLQAQAILDMSLSQLTGLEVRQDPRRTGDLTQLITELESILADPPSWTAW